MIDYLQLMVDGGDSRLVQRLGEITRQLKLLARECNDRWIWQVHSNLERAIILHSLNVEIPLTEIYPRLNF